MSNSSSTKNNLKTIVLQETDWKIPILTDGMDVKELAKRVRFESNNVIRILTRDNRDILFLLSQDKTVKMISEVQLENFFEVQGH